MSWLGAVAVGLATTAAAATPDGESVEFFEKRIRPILVAHCLECHSDTARPLKGGLRLDSRSGWERGGDSGPALSPGRPEDSLLLRAVRWKDPELQMPPKTPLSASEIASLEEWVRRGAPDPRTEPSAPPAADSRTAGTAASHWAYEPVVDASAPAVRDAAWPANAVDAFILARWEPRGLRPAPPADASTLGRRLYFDLTGLPPSPGELAAFERAVASDRTAAVAALVERLLASPRFGEHWGRHWLDVARFGESLTLRGFVFREAWRYRDYVIESFNHDIPFDQFVREQIAGDLLPWASPGQRHRQLVAATFLALGDANLEEQDKQQLEMDVVDEQLDTMGKAFLGQAIGCARCHDHKFDPIPTRDYYALAGILRNARLLRHANVSEWLENPLPVEPVLEEALRRHEASVAALEQEIARARDATSRGTALTSGVISPDRLPGIVVDANQATAVGLWIRSTHSGHYIGDGYLHDDQQDKGGKTLSFAPVLTRAGRYEVRFAYQHGASRATRVPVTVFHADGETRVLVNQQDRPGSDGRFVSLGEFRFEANGFGYVLVSNEGTQGHVTADAVQFLPAGEGAPRPPRVADAGSASAGTAESPAQDLPALETRLRQLKTSGPKRPMAMGVQESSTIRDSPIHIRGSVHLLGEVVPRGFLSFGRPPPTVVLSAAESGRVQLAAWMASPEHPLTARVYVNRAWLWLMGEGIVRTPDNFGTTGDVPSHPELLDHLAARFVETGWSTKALIREIVLSRTYQQSGAGSADAATPDPENRLWSRIPRRRLPAESVRDALLAVGGGLRLEGGGRTFPATLTADFGHLFEEPLRSVYVPAFRNARPGLFEAFDVPPPGMVTGRRNTSTVVTQALFLLNDPWVRDQASAAARRVLAEGEDDEARLDLAWRAALGRLPLEAERESARVHLRKGDPVEAWTDLLQALFASADFRSLD